MLRANARPGVYEGWFRERCVAHWISGRTLVWIAEHMGCDRRTVHSWVERWRHGYPLQARTERAKRPTRIMNPERTALLLRLVRRQNDLFLDELADALYALDGVRPSVSTVCRTLVHENGITRKQVRTAPFACAGRVHVYPDPPRMLHPISCTVAPGRRMRSTRPRSRMW
jgi:transposase